MDHVAGWARSVPGRPGPFGGGRAGRSFHGWEGPAESTVGSTLRSDEASQLVFGTQLRIRRPVLLILVYGCFLVLVGITAAAQSVMVAAHFSASALNDVVGSDSATTRAFVN